jgi:type IV pilus assembly protein PilN
MAVELMDKLAKSIPVGVTLNNVRQQGPNVTLIGTSQSNARVSAYLRSLEEMDLFVNPELQYVRAAAKPTSRTEPYEYAIQVRLHRKSKTEQDEGEGVQTGASAGAY